ncbi:MAG: acyl-CoA dehydrogenase family protein, partial [Halobacteria archaeon]|nr:acyl-CoA dehydrogenase family protein [Halobacteria archaeon]
MSYLELDTEYEGDDIEMLRNEVHRFAEEVMRPAAVEIDAMERDEYLGITERGSPYWDVMEGIKGELGAHRAVIPSEFGGGGLSGREFHTLFEELGWGSSGLAIAFGVDIIPAMFAVMSFDDEVRESFLDPYLEDDEAEFQGCWGLTEPAHGSELVMTDTLLREGTDDEISETQASAEKAEDGDGWIINGVKSSWVTAAPVATHCALHVNMNP